MENIENNIQSVPQNINPEFNYKSYGNGLFWAGIVGVVLTGIFYFFGKKLATDGLSGPYWENYVLVLVVYYLINSLLVIWAGRLLKNLNRTGIYILVLATISILGSLFIIDSGTNLFFYTIASSLFAIMTGAPVGVLFFLGSITVNLLKIRKWFKITT